LRSMSLPAFKTRILSGALNSRTVAKSLTGIEVQRPSLAIDQPPADVHSHLGVAEAFAGQSAASISTAAIFIETQITQTRFVMQQT